MKGEEDLSSTFAFPLSPFTFCLTEGSVYEMLRRDPRVEFDPFIAHAALIYDDRSRKILRDVHARYIDIARRLALPMLVFADTWRASGERVAQSRFRGRHVNADNVAFMRQVASTSAFVGALVGPAGDAYDPSVALSTDVAMRYHSTQIAELAGAKPDLLMAATLPALSEARGIATVMATSGVAWMMSFVVRPDGRLLDGTSLEDAIDAIDSDVPARPVGYAINCVHPDVARQALSSIAPRTANRIVLFQGNASARRPEELDGAAELEGSDPDAFASSALALLQNSAVRVVGGCCGTDERHMSALAETARRNAIA